jgi:predicted dehydrogenase
MMTSDISVSDAPLRVLHVGITNRGRWPLDKCTPESGFRPSVLCDLNTAALAETAAARGLPASACFGNLDEALAKARGQIDCAIVCTPTIHHVPMASQLIKAGVPVLIEKGMAPDWSLARQLANLATRTPGAVTAVSQNYRYLPGERTIRRAIHDPGYSAHVGRVHLISYSQPRVRPQPRTLTYPFASIWDMSCHHLDNMLDWLGPIESITAFAWRAPWSAYPHDDANTTAHLHFANGTHVHYLHAHDTARATLEIEVHGERGALVRKDSQLTFNTRPLQNFQNTPLVEVTPEPGNGEADVLRDFRAYILQGVEPGISVRNNLETMAACEMMVRSISQHRTCRRAELDS